MPKLATAAALITSLILVACAFSSMEVGRTFQNTEAPPNGFARLYVFRPAFTNTGSGDKPTVLVNGQVRSKLGSDRYTDVVLSPGTHVVSLRPQMLEPSFWKGQISMTLEANTTYFLAVWITTEAVNGVQIVPGVAGLPFMLLPASGTRGTGVQLELVPEKEAVPFVRGMRYTASSSNVNGRP